jgi:hypothetical protein
VLEATVVHWVARDGVGRLRLATGEEVRFGASACPFPPSVGLQVHVLELAPHPMGGQRALRIAALPGQSVDALFEAAGPVPGAREVNEFAQLTDEVGLLGIVVKRVPGDRASLRAWLERFGATVDFSHPTTPLLTIERTPWRVWRCTADVAGGKGVISLAPHLPFSAETARTQALAATKLGATARIDAFTQLQPLLRWVAQACEPEVGVIVHQAGGVLASSNEWRERAARDPLTAWAHQTTVRSGEAVIVGLRALSLPDVFGNGVKPEALWSAARALVALGRLPQPGDALGELKVESAEDAWVRVAQ